MHEQLRLGALLDLKLLLELVQEFLLHVSKVSLKVMNGSIKSLDVRPLDSIHRCEADAYFGPM